jgi:hypothetical protein
LHEQVRSHLTIGPVSRLGRWQRVRRQGRTRLDPPPTRLDLESRAWVCACDSGCAYRTSPTPTDEILPPNLHFLYWSYKMVIRSRAACTSYFDPGHRLANLLCPAYRRKCVDFQLSCQRFGDCENNRWTTTKSKAEERSGFQSGNNSYHMLPELLWHWVFELLYVYDSHSVCTRSWRSSWQPQARSGAGGMLWQVRYNTVHQDRHPRGICFIHNSAATLHHH